MARLRPAVAIATMALALGLAGCSTTTVVLLPEADGRKTEVTVQDSRGEVVLDKPYAGVKRTALGTRPYESSPDEVTRLFGPAIAAQPRREQSYTLHFDEGRDQVSEASRATLEAALADIAARPVKDVLVIGHTDRVGTDAVNDALARQRADSVRAELVRRGVAADGVQASGRGSREPSVPTAAGVPEPRNRRVEIVVR
jgi:outer membrane protein OmpA-like peptidoglycan-associated protein